MGKRRKAREIVLQVLYESEFSDSGVDEILKDHAARRSSSAETIEHAGALLSAVKDHLPELDASIGELVANWDFKRVSLVDKNILRSALAEIMFFPEVPLSVVINEAIEIANRYSSTDAGKFINGILDRFAHLHPRDPA